MNKQGIYKKLLNIAVLPVMIFGIFITVFSYGRFKNTMYEESRSSMANIASAVKLAYDLKYGGNYSLVQGADKKYNLYKGEADITNETDIIDQLAGETQSEISVLYMDMRVNTTLSTSSGQRIAGVCTNEETTRTVINEESEAFYEDISITGNEYLVLYVPLRNDNSKVIGMIEIAKESSSIKKEVWKACFPVLLLALPGMLIAAFVAFKQTKKITDVLKAIQNFLNQVAGGNLSAELETKHLRRTDELGDISKSSVSMQRSIRNSIETDTLTSLPNRRYLFSAFSKVTKKADETGMPFSLAICDIDFFKKVNDTYGHNAGDEVLKAVAAQLKSGMQGNGFATRWGGEEFILVFDKKEAEYAAKTLEGILDKIRDMTVSTEAGDIKVTMTFGVMDGYTNDIDILIENADAKLYYGKQHGRNQVVFNMDE